MHGASPPSRRTPTGVSTGEESTTAAAQRYLDELAGDSPAEQVVRALLKAGVDPNEAIQTKKQVGGYGAKNGTSALTLAVENAHFELALELVAAGSTNREAAARLFISEATVKTHLLHIYAKLRVNDSAAAVAAGFERGLLPRAVD